MLERKQKFCADDWGISPGVNAGILELARNDLLWSVSLMANTDFLLEGLDELLSFQKNGLRFYIHFNLTFGSHKEEISKSATLVNTNGCFYDFNHILLKSYTRQISYEECRATFNGQCRRLLELNVPLQGVDGHHHVHLLPVISEAVAKTQLELGIHEYRLMVDPNHLASFLQSKIAKFTLRNSALHFTTCGYSLPEDLKSKNRFMKKLNHFERLIVHPASYDDFDSLGIVDTLKEERVTELKKILEYTI